MGEIRNRKLASGQVVTARTNHCIRKRCGCPRKEWTRCSHPWHAKFSWQGHEHRVSLHKLAKKPADYVMLQGEAKSLYRLWTTSIEGGQEAVKKAATVTLDTIATAYKAEYVNQPDRRPRAAKEMERLVDAVCEAVVTRPEGGNVRLGRLPASEITKDCRTAWRLTCKRAGIVGLRLHDLRRESGSRLLETPDVSLTDVRDFLGHASVTQTNTYLSTTARRLKAAVAKRDAARTNLAHPLEADETPSDAPAVTH